MIKITLDLSNVAESAVANFVLGESFISAVTDDVIFTWAFIEVNLAEGAEEKAARDAAEDLLRMLEGSVDDMPLDLLVQKALLAELAIGEE